MTIDYTVTINGKPASEATGPGRVVVTVPSWLSVFVDVSSGPVINFTNGRSSWNEGGVHDIGDFVPGDYIIRVANSDAQGKDFLGFRLSVPIAAASAKVSVAEWIGVCADDGTVEQNTTRLLQGKLNAINLWTGFNNTTGTIDNFETLLPLFNGYAARDINVFIGLTPWTNVGSVVSCAPAIRQLTTRLDTSRRKRFLAQIINEPNNTGTKPRYWPSADAPSAFAYAAPHYAALRVAGILSACPCPTTGEDPQGTINIWEAARKAGHLTCDVLAVNVYARGPALFDKCLTAYKAYGDSVGKSIYLKEWADLRFDEEAFYNDLPQFIGSIKANAKYSAWFIGPYIAKHCPPAEYAWNNRDNTTTRLLGRFAEAIG